MAKKRPQGADAIVTEKPQAETGGDAFDRADPATAGSGSVGDQVETSPATAAAVQASESPPAPRGGIRCNACSTDTETVWTYPVSPGWNKCHQCGVKVRNLTSLQAAQRARNRGGKSRSAR